MTYTDHPVHYLNPNGNLEPGHLDRLTRDADSVQAIYAGTQITFKAATVKDDRDIVLTISRDNRRYQAQPRPHCICQAARNPLHCQCRQIPCPTCNETFTALEMACQFTLCLNDHCPSCEHYRETCNATQIIEAITGQVREEQAATPTPDNIAESYIQAVADHLGEGTDAPFYPITAKALENSPFLRTTTKLTEGPWHFQDGSTAVKTQDGLWLTTSEI